VDDKISLPIVPEYIDNPTTWKKLQADAMAAAFRAGKSWEEANVAATKVVEKARREAAKRVAKEESEAERDLRRKRIDAVKEDIRQRREAARAEKQLAQELNQLKKAAVRQQTADEKASRNARVTADRQAFAVELSNVRRLASEKKALQRELAADERRNSDRELAQIRAAINARKSAFNDAKRHFNSLAKSGSHSAGHGDRENRDRYEDVRRFGRNGIRMLAREGMDRTQRLAGNSARAAGLDFDVFEAGRRANELSQKSLVLATQSPDSTVNPVINAQRVEAATKNVAAETGIDREQVFGAVQKYMELTGNLNDALSMLPEIAKRSVAFGTAIEDVSESFATIRKRLGDDADVKAISRTFDVMGSQGRAGAVEIREFAKAIIPRLGPYSTGFGVSDASLALSGGNKEEAQLLSIVGLAQAIKGETRGNTLTTGRALESFANQFMGGTSTKRFEKATGALGRKGLSLSRMNARGEKENLPIDEMIAAILMFTGGDQNLISSITQNQPASAVLRAFLPEFNTAKEETENMLMKKKGFTKPSQLSKADREEAYKAGGNAVVQSARMKVWGGGLMSEGRVDKDFATIQGSDAAKLARNREMLNQQLESAGQSIVKAVADNAPQIKSAVETFSSVVQFAAKYPKTALAAAMVSPVISATVSQIATSAVARILPMVGGGGALGAVLGTGVASYMATSYMLEETDFGKGLFKPHYDEMSKLDARNKELDSEYMILTNSRRDNRLSDRYQSIYGEGTAAPPESIAAPSLLQQLDMEVPTAKSEFRGIATVTRLDGETIRGIALATKAALEGATLNIEGMGNTQLSPAEAGRADWVTP
jgi:hypothetical protein